MGLTINNFNNYLIGLLLFISGLIILFSFPGQNMYKKTADEGNYYRQAMELVNNGTAGFKIVAEKYINTPTLHDTPHPLRVGAIVISALGLNINDSYTSLSVISFLSFLCLLLVSYSFFKRQDRTIFPVLIVTFMAFSPLGMAMARRALTDSLAYTVAASAVFAFYNLVNPGSRYRGVLFAGLMFLAIQIKETALFLLPFFALYFIVMKYRRETDLTYLEALLYLSLPVFMSGLTYVVVYGWDTVTDILGILRKTSPYSAIWGQGPWYKYLIDYLMMEPFTFIIALMASGFMLLSGVRDQKILFFFGLGVYLLLIYGFISKNVRYLILLDLPIRFFAAWFVYRVIESVSFSKRDVTLGFLVVIILFNYRSFAYYFKKANIYDTISYNLLEANHIVPPMILKPVDKPKAEVNPDSVRSQIDQYMKSGIAYYRGKEYQKSVEAFSQLIKLDPKNSIAYSNLASCYNGLQKWQEAIDACNEALRINPGFELAKNNKRWAERQLEQGNR